MNAEELVNMLHSRNPDVRFAVYGNAKSAIAYMDRETEKWIACYAATVIGGVWTKLPGQAVLVNGKPLYAETEWKEVLFDKESGDTDGH